MADPNRLTYTRGGMEKLRQAYERMSREELLDLACHMQKTYVLDQTIPFDIPIPERQDAQEKIDAPGSEQAVEDPNDTPVRRFARLIEGLKRRTSLPQLEGFSTTEDGKAVLVIDNQRVTFGERVTIEFVPMRQAAAAAAAARPPERPRPGAPQESPEGRTEDEARDEVSRPAAPAPSASAPFAAPSAPPARSPGPRLVPPPAPRGPMPAPAARRGAPGAPAGPAKPAAPAQQKPPAPEPSSAPPSDESGAERFRGLELD